MSLSDNYLMLSALQHHAYCPRQCALIHIEQTWDENLFTMRGNRVHENVNIPEDELIEDIRVERAIPLWSHKLGLTGIADVVEFYEDKIPYPVEYKVGSRKARDADSIQLCAQALCLEEMLNCTVEKGAIFHHKSRRRREVFFDEKLRSQTHETIIHTKALLAANKLPPPVADNRCSDCSLLDACMPYALKDFSSSIQDHNIFAIASDL
ncbi:MAG: CRISPR-associated protein Cas4 [Cyanobacteria bacterium P01_F01_bin.86]